MNGQSRDTGNIGLKTQEEHKQNRHRQHWAKDKEEHKQNRHRQHWAKDTGRTQTK